jgi:predicted transposase YdaD
MESKCIVGDIDNSYKQIFSHQEMMRDLLHGFVKEDWVAQLDFSTLEKVGGSYVTDDIRDREDDIIWRVRWGPEWLYIYVILEFQATVDSFMAVRIGGYVHLLYQDLIKNGTVKQSQNLPPILPIVLYNGKKPWTAATEIGDLIAPAPSGLDRFRPQMRYLLIDEVRYTDAELVPLRNLAAALFRLEKSQKPEDIRLVLRELIDWLKAPEQTSLRRAFTVWLSRVLLPRRVPGIQLPEMSDLHEVDTMLAETVQEWTKEWKEEGRQAGREEEAVSMLSRLLPLKFGPMPTWASDKINNASIKEIESWSERIFEADSLDAVFKE